jgi:predicted DNA-binding transcriptional regulator AlpA
VADLRPIAVDAVAAAELFSMSKSTWRRLVAAGRAPQGWRLGGLRRWSVAELDAWDAAGRPCADAWAVIMRQARGRINVDLGWDDP